MKRRVVTTWPEGADYAPAFLESYTKHWNTELYVYYEGKKPEFRHKLVKYFDLNADKERKAFLERNKGREKPKSDPGNAYRWDWDRFCHKVFALTHHRNVKGVDWLIWLDADVITHDTMDEAFLDQVCKGDVSYVGRDEFTHPDCAFVAYGNSEEARQVLLVLRHLYVSDELFELPEWHDSFLFKDILARRVSPQFEAVNLSPGIPGMQVFDDCILGKKMKHLKGALRKKGIVPQVPGYSSQKELQTPVSGMRPIQIKTKNCVPHEKIQANIHYNLTLLDKYVVPCEKHNGIITFCSGGPSLRKYYDQIRSNREKGHKIACVKTAHDDLIAEGIIPDFCVLLDPRSHVQDFIENPHPEVVYLVASMVHPTTLDRLLDHGARVLGYHAHVGAEEQEVMKARKRNAMLIGGGCSAAMRGISVFFTLGFAEFHLYGYDLCYAGKPFKGKKPPVKEDGSPKYLEVEALGRKFWTDPEKIAQAQDFERIIKEDQRVKIAAYGDGIIPHIWASAYKPLPKYEDLIAGIGTPPRISESGAEPGSRKRRD